MKKHYEIADIEQYFQLTNNIAPIYAKEKVHQIINMPKAPARLKGKTNNLLKFTVMTTLLAIVLSTILFWPKTQEEIPNSNGQIPNGIVQTMKSEPVLKKEKTPVVENGFIPVSSNESKEEMPNIEELKHELFKSEETEVVNEPKPVTSPSEINSDQSTIQPVDGNKFLLKLSNEELERIGFHITDTSIAFLKCIDNAQYFFKYQVSKDSRVIRGTSTVYLQVSKSDNSCASTNKIKPSCQTNIFYSELKIVDQFEYEEFNSVNDTLVPIIIPLSLINPEVIDDILWFTGSDELLEILSEKHKSFVNKFLEYRTAKRALPQSDLIQYEPPKLIDESKIITLDQHQMERIGFEILPDSLIYSGKISSASTELIKTKNLIKTIYSTTSDENGLGENGCMAVLVTRKDGSPYQKFGKILDFLFSENMEYGSQFGLLIPVMVKSSPSFFSEDVIFWYYPTEAFFDAMPKEIGIALKNEYNYVIAKDKSALVKPECKYFDECKNTLDVSNFKVFPNPANNNATVTFKLNEPIEGKISLVDLAGRERQVLQAQTSFTKGSHRIDVDVSNVPEGIYLITLSSDKGIQTQRFIVAR